MNYYRVEYLTEDEIEKTAFVKAASEQLIPFALREQDKLLKHVVSSKKVSLEDYEKASLPSETKSVPVEDQSYDDPKYPAREGAIYSKHAKVGTRYVAIESDVVVEVTDIGYGGVQVIYPPTTKDGVISRHTEVIPYKEAEHKHLLKRIIASKKEKEKET